MLINEDHAISVQYRNVCQSVTHEIAHQWFGNLVSIHWWNDVYVIEGWFNVSNQISCNEFFLHRIC